MAKIPDYTALGGRQAPSPQYGLTPYSEAMGAPGRATQQLAGVLGNAANDFAKLYQEEKRKEAAIRAEDDHNKIKTWMLEKSIGEKGYKTSILNEQAVKTPWINDTLSEFDKIAGEMTSGATDEAHKQNLEKIISAERFNLLSDMTRHRAQQENNYKNIVFEGVKQTSAAGAAANYSNLNQVMAERVRLEAAIDANLTDKDIYDKGARKAFKNKDMSEFSISVINAALANNNPEKAKEYFNMVIKNDDGTFTKVSEEIDPDKRSRIEKNINESSLLGESQAWLEDRIARNLTPKQMYDDALKLDGEKQKAAEEQIDRYRVRLSATQRFNEKFAYKEISRAYGQSNDLEKVKRENHDLWDSMSPSDQQRMINSDRSAKRAAANGTDVVDNLEQLAELIKMQSDNESEFNEYAASGFSGWDLSQKTKKRLVFSIGKDKDITQTKAIKDQSLQFMADMGYDTKNLMKKNTKGEEMRKILSDTQNWAFSEYEKNGAWPNPKEYKAHFLEMSQTIKTGGLWTSEQPLFKAAKSLSEKYNMDVNQVSSMWIEMQGFYKSKGKELTKEEFEEAIRRKTGTK